MNKLDERISKWGMKLTHILTVKNLSIFLTAVYLLSLIPLLWIGWYNYPSADDYSIGSWSRLLWQEEHSLLKVIVSAVAYAAEEWLNWMGYFTSEFLMAMPPSIFGERAYVLTTWIMLGMLSLSVWYLFRAIFVKVFGADKRVTLCITMLMLFASVQCMCQEGRNEAFYWYSGAANYIFVHSMSLFFYGLLISAFYDKGKKRGWDIGAAVFLGFLTGGGNQMTALNVAVVLALAGIFIFFQKKTGEFRYLLAPGIAFFIGFLLNVAAPGNSVRAEDAAGMNPVKAVFVSFYECLDRAVGQWTTWAVIVLLLLMLPFFWKAAERTSFRFPYPVAVVILGYCIVSAMVTPPVFALGNMEAGRLQALVYLMYILVLTLVVFYLTGWVRKKWENRTAVKKEEFSAAGCWWMLVCMLFLMGGSALMIIPEPHYYTWSSAMTDLFNGNAKTYGAQREKRIEIYENGAGKSVEVEAVTVHPALLYFSDIQEDETFWENIGLSRYYKLESVRIKDQTAE